MFYYRITYLILYKGLAINGDNTFYHQGAKALGNDELLGLLIKFLAENNISYDELVPTRFDEISEKEYEEKTN